MTRAQCR